MAKVIDLRPPPEAPVPGEQADVPPLVDVPTMLRRLAADIELGAYGVAEARATFGEDAIIRAAVVLRVSGQRPAIGGYGVTSPAQTYMDLCAGAQELMNMDSPERT